MLNTSKEDNEGNEEWNNSDRRFKYAILDEKGFKAEMSAEPESANLYCRHGVRETVADYTSVSRDAANNPVESANNINATKWPEVKFRDKRNVDKSESQRKRNSRNRLSNRRSTGINVEDVQAAATLGPQGAT
ncbi:hypothetical protein FQR65_LT00873 [Abscondita terminalis]|nr:hypothetical protein FQR65_LT00873 [Abscondita terminalis]